MKKLILIALFLFLAMGSFNFSNAQINESFEGIDSVSLPAGWSLYNRGVAIPRNVNWTVRDSGKVIPGISDVTTKSHTGLKAVTVSWQASTGQPGNIADAWLVTKRVTVLPGDSIVFWAFGGATPYSDSMSVWVNATDSTANSFVTSGTRVSNILWPIGSTYGNWTRYAYSLTSFVGQSIWVGFRYNMNATVNGFSVQLDDVKIGTLTSVTPVGTNVPGSFALKQNYPNPFNPVTKISFDLPRSEFATLIVYNAAGKEMASLVNEFKTAGSYEASFDASNLSSGIYYYTLTAGDFRETKKMMLVK